MSKNILGLYKIKRFIIIPAAVMYIFYMYLDLCGKFSQMSAVIKYISIIFCTLIALCVFVENKNLSSFLAFIAFIFTLAADSQLLFDGNYMVGIILFFICQQCHSYIINNNFICFFKALVCSVIIGSIIYIAYYSFTRENDMTVLASVIYFTAFTENNILANFGCRKRRHIMYRLGLFLFFLCDINVSLYNMTEYIEIEVPNILYKFASVAMWGFYLPGQLLIARYAGNVNTDDIYADASNANSIDVNNIADYKLK